MWQANCEKVSEFLDRHLKPMIKVASLTLKTLHIFREK